MTGREESCVEPEGVDGWAGAVRTQAERPDAFWAAQRAGIRERTRMHRARVWGWTVAMGASMAAAAAAVALLRVPNPEPVPAPVALAAVVVANGDDQLLLDVEQAVMREVPLAFEPVDFLLPGARDPDGE